MSFFNFGAVPPSFMIIGVQKGGTSSLYHYLSQHPQIIAPKIKELHYFDTVNATPAKAYLKNFPKSYFSRKTSFDATPNYIYYPGTARKIHEFNPSMKFIVVLRDPVERAFSAWNMYEQMQHDNKRQKQFIAHEKLNEKEKLHSYLYKEDFPNFEKWVDIELGDTFDKTIIEPSMIRRGYYKDQIEVYFNYFDKSAFLFLDFEAFKQNMDESLKSITSFLGLSSFENISIDLAPKNVRTYKEKMGDETYQKLRLHYLQKNKGLEELVNLKLSWMES